MASARGRVGVAARDADHALAGKRALTLAPEDLVLHLATHFAVHHSLTGLLRQWDLALVLAQAWLDWPRLLARAEAWRVRRAVFFALRGVAEAFASVVPPAVLDDWRPRGPRAALLASLLRGAADDRRRRLEHVVTLLLIDRARDVGVSVRGALWPSADWLRARYGHAPVAPAGSTWPTCAAWPECWARPAGAPEIILPTRREPMLRTTIAGSLPKPAWLADPRSCGRRGRCRPRARRGPARRGAARAQGAGGGRYRRGHRRRAVAAALRARISRAARRHRLRRG